LAGAGKLLAMANELWIKICGVTDAEDARQAVLFGADAVGLNFYPRSPRCVSREAAASILRQLPAAAEAVAVFVRAGPTDAFEPGPDLVRIGKLQCHGEHPNPGDLFARPLIPAFQVSGRESLQAVRRYLDRCRAVDRLPPAILVDAHDGDRHGGTGRTAPWGLLADFRPGVPLILAGGLNPANVAEAVRIVRPYGVDVASGVEDRPGRKDPDRVRRFIENARAAATAG
jgi:phosphoribosylanthranilate isomerase